MLIVFISRFRITQGFIPIAGYNYGVNKFERVKETIEI
jgi:hypothetical protein